MKKQSKYALGALALVGVVGYLMVTGMKDSMTYYFTPAELQAKVAGDPSARALGAKLGGRVVPGTVSFDQTTLELRFTISEIDLQTGEMGDARYPVRYVGPLPDTFEEGRDVVAEGRLDEGGVFQATHVLTKCGSRYEGVADGELVT